MVSMESARNLASPVTFRFANVGPLRDVELRLGRLTIVAGRNNTGKTYLTTILHGFLKAWEDWPNVPRYLFAAPADFPNIKGIAATLAEKGRAVIPLDSQAVWHHRRTLLEQVARASTKASIPLSFGSPRDRFPEVRVSAEIGDLHPSWAPTPNRTVFGKANVKMSHDGAKLVASFEESEPGEPMDEIERHVAWAYYHFLLHDLLPPSFILSPDRPGISLFHPELDFERNEVIEVLNKLADEKIRKSVPPILFLAGISDRYSLPVNDNIDYARHLAELRGESASLRESRKLTAHLRNMIGGHYGTAGNDVRFTSRARGETAGFSIPLHHASSSARALTDLYFYLRHEATYGHLLMIDGPELHLDTRNQILLARLLVSCAKAGLHVLVATHSDYLVKEINNLIMIRRGFPHTNAAAKRLGYKRADRLDPKMVRAYVVEDGSLTECAIGRFGIEMPVFDKTLADIDRASTEFSALVERAK